MDISKENRFSAEKALIYFSSHRENNKVLICESSRFFFSPMLPTLLWELKIIAYRGTFTIPSSSKLELLCQWEMTSWYYIVTKRSIVDDLWVRDTSLFFFLWETLPKRSKFNQVAIYIFKVKKKSTRIRCEIYPKVTIKAPKQC